MAIKTLYVGNIPYSATEDEMIAQFAVYGGQNPRIIEGRGFAFIDVDADQLDAAINDKHDAEMGGAVPDRQRGSPPQKRRGRKAQRGRLRWRQRPGRVRRRRSWRLRRPGRRPWRSGQLGWQQVVRL